MKILISPGTSRLADGKRNAKDYPFWDRLLYLLKLEGHSVMQVGLSGETEYDLNIRKNLSLAELRKLISLCDVWVSVDSMFQHLATLEVKKPGVVVFSKSDPRIFGHPENINLYKEEHLRKKQFLVWRGEVFEEDKFPSPEEIIAAIKQIRL